MRLARSASVAKRQKNLRLSLSRARKKHKRLDAICEKAYTRSHRGVEAESSECNAGGGLGIDESELRRSTRVRRAPVVLDASPPPARKRARLSRGSGNDFVGRDKRSDGMKTDSPCSTSKDVEEEEGGWRSRLRSRAKSVRGKGDSWPRGKRKLFDDSDGLEKGTKLEIEELDDKKEGRESGKSTVVKTKRPGRVNASKVLRNAHQEIEPHAVKEDDKENDEHGVLENNDWEDPLHLNSGVGCGSEVEVEDANSQQLVEEETEKEREKVKETEIEIEIEIEKEKGKEKEKENEKGEGVIFTGSELKDCVGNEKVDTLQGDKQVEVSEKVEEGNRSDAIEVGKVPTDQAEDERCDHKPQEDESASHVDKTKFASTYRIKARLKLGRRCGLCGGGTDGKPPKKLVQDGAGSDNEAYSGSSASEDSNYDIWDGFGDEPGWLGRLLGPINDRFGIAGIWVHQHCAVWSPEV